MYYLVMATAPSRRPSPARDRLLETADRLFYHEGFRAVGIDRVIAEAGVAKMTLYAHFKSKDELILAVLQRREHTENEFFKEGVARHSKGKPKLQAFFVTLKEWMRQPEFRGCAFINATVELADPNHPVTVFARGQRERFDQMVRNLLMDGLSGQKNADELLPAIMLLVAGLIVTVQMKGDPNLADTAWAAAQKLTHD